MLQGYSWGDNRTREIFGSVDDMNRWLIKRPKLIDKSIDLRPYPLVLCLLHLCRRNIKPMEDKSICLLGWGHTGFPTNSLRLRLLRALATMRLRGSYTSYYKDNHTHRWRAGICESFFKCSCCWFAVHMVSLKRGLESLLIII